jgi:ABC-type transport system involved in multi-copper enzyme maturation permease subunit
VGTVYIVMAIGVSLLMIDFAIRGNQTQRSIGSILNGGQVALGFLLLSVTCATSLAEERVRGSLDILLATPMSTRAIIWGKWWGSYRGVLLLSVPPTLVTCVYAARTGHMLGIALEAGFILAFGAALTSLGLALATWIPRFGRAVAMTVTAYILVTVGWFFLIVTLTQHTAGVTGPGLASASPFIGSIFPLVVMVERGGHDWDACVAWMVFWSFTYLGIALALFSATLATFDRCLGRVSGAPRSAPTIRKPQPEPEPLGVLD